MERVRRTDYADGTDGLALKRERGRDAHNSKKIDLENYKDLKVWKLKECLIRGRNRAKFNQIIQISF